MSEVLTDALRLRLQQAHEHYAAGGFDRAQAQYLSIVAEQPGQSDALQSLVAIALQQRQPAVAEGYLQQLVAAHPLEPSYTDYLANAMLQRGAIDDAVACYEALLRQLPDPGVSHFNFAVLLRRAGRSERALEQYQRALAAGIDNPAEVYSNISILHSDNQQHALAEQALQQALALNPQYVPALYNLALLCEESDRWSEAATRLQEIIALDPGHVDAHVRLAQGQPAVDAPANLVPRLQQLLAANAGQTLAAESLHYALGKCADDLGQYDTAATHYQQGNRFSAERVGPYDRAAAEQLTRQVCEFAERPGDLADYVVRPIFVCGMFRSGSTLLEQMLAAHSALRAGGEIGFLQHDSGQWGAQFSKPADYVAELERLFPGADPSTITNKQPENLFQVPLICRAFPNARILVTDRAVLDNALAVYFQQLSPRYRYANDLEDIGHYYQQCQQVLESVQSRYADNVHVVAYDALVQAPEATLSAALQFLGLSWEATCLRFYDVPNRVRTASVWQVRQPLHTRSLGRAEHYLPLLRPLAGHLGQIDR